MKWLRILSCPFFLTALASPALAQWPDVHVEASYVNAPLSSILHDFYRTYDVRFAYDNSALDTVLVTIDLRKTPLREALVQLLEPHGFSFEMIRETIVVIPRPVKDSPLTATREHFAWSGTVRDGTTSETLPYATIRVAETPLGTRADDDGRFTLYDIPSDTCTLIISYVGYHDLRLKLTPDLVEKDKVINLFMQQGMMPVAIIYGRNMQLLGSTEEVSTQQISIQDYSNLSSPAQPDVGSTAQMLPGLDATSETAGELNIRGSGADQSRVILDGMTIYHLDHFFGVFSAINPDAVKSMQVIKGGLDARYGGMTGGVVEMNGLDGNLRSPSVQLDLGLLSASLVTEIPVGTSERSSVLFTMRHSLTDLFASNAYRSIFNTVYNASVTLPGQSSADVFGMGSDPDFGFYDLNTRITLRPSVRDKFTFSAYSGRDHLALNYSSVLQNPDLTLNYNDQNEWGNTGGAFHWKRTWTAKSITDLRMSYTNYHSDLEGVNEVIHPNDPSLNEATLYRENNSLRDLSISFSNSVRRKLSSTEWGLSFNRYGVEESILTVDSLEGHDQDALVSAVYGQHEWQLGKRWKLKPGLRLVRYGPSAVLYGEPRLHTLYSLSDKVQLKGAVGRYHQFLSRVREQSLAFDQGDSWQLAGEGLPVLESDQVVTGIRWMGENAEVDLEGYLKWNRGTSENVSNFRYSGGSESALQLVTGHGVVAGMDLLIRRDLLRHHFALGYTLLKTTNEYPELQEASTPESFDQRHEVKIIYQWKGDRWNFSAAFYVGSGKPYTRV